MISIPVNNNLKTKTKKHVLPQLIKVILFSINHRSHLNLGE